MRVFVTGATGFVGTAVVQELRNAGHEVLGLARSEAAAQTLAAAGASVQRGGLEDVDGLARAAAEVDGVIHTAFIHDFSKMAASAEIDNRVIAAIGGALAGSGRPFVVTSALGVLASGHVHDEDATPDPRAVGGHRGGSELTAIALASRGVRASVVRLPPSVHGDGDHGFVPAVIRTARDKGISAYLGDGQTRWAAVHKFDAAQLYRLALETGAAGARYHAVHDEGLPIKNIAEIIGRRLGVPVASVPREQAAEQFAWLGRFLANDMTASSARTREQLGWHPRHPGLLADLEHGRYFDA